MLVQAENIKDKAYGIGCEGWGPRTLGFRSLYLYGLGHEA
jgi:hypothetical protein